MSSLQRFNLPDVGEGLVEAEILTWSVRPGDTVEVNQIIVEIETAKAAVELPSPYAGVVKELHVKEGETVSVGTPIITVDTAGPGDAAPAMLVGYGPREGHSVRQRRRGGRAPGRPESSPGHARPSAKPPVRKLAKDLGVSLHSVAPSGPGGVITREDVHRAAAAVQPGPEPLAVSPAPAGGSGRRETRVPIKGVRRQTARAMTASAFTAPHVTEFVTVDITETMRLREVVSARREFRHLRLSPLLFVARALLLAVRRTPEANTAWDEAAREIVFKHYVNLGIAAATDRGLIVPNIKDADRMSLLELAEALTTLAETARSGKSIPHDMSDGTITITNIGTFGVDTGTPLLNPGEAAILAVGTIRRTPWVVGSGADERIEPRSTVQLALSFDHRLMDGQQGSQLLSDIAAILTTPGLAML
ncbi:dihydrolipoamide acetyltransferase family protein [Sinosporangium siamense]|uniref:Dihydrolipoamide acetyltransferase component of pyruvate dehydrogenase complex n=1 Tax=Sinosporangium siamense TaxID=1367973 RepID=A0A919V9J9_9ACTN|nr:dihydrolipoamide acetyltransferase family protein [Sinosporangium siamense]GII95386.1 dihydrolipoamide acetyltransferase component of pyruvate dehydrogenase complex [Sinosporangium siamense]